MHTTRNGRSVVQSVADMYVLAAQLVERIEGGMPLLLVGELGSGKTTFVQGVAMALGVEDYVTSSSFTIVSEYVVQHPLVHRLLHVDLYRLSQPTFDPAVAVALESVGLSDTLVAIEWADRLTWAPPAGTLRILFEYGATEQERIVTVRRQ